jgi:hypothetical protein
MWGFITQPGFATAVLDFTNDLSPLIIGLVGLVALPAGMIAFAAVRHYLSQGTATMAETAPAAADFRDAA